MVGSSSGHLWWPRGQSVHPRKWSRCEVPRGSQALTSVFRIAVDSWKAVGGACCSEVKTKDAEAASNLLPYPVVVTQHLLGICWQQETALCLTALLITEGWLATSLFLGH